MDGNKMPDTQNKTFFKNTIKYNSLYYFSSFNLNIVTQFLNGFFECWIERGRWIDSCDFSSADDDDDEYVNRNAKLIFTTDRNQTWMRLLQLLIFTIDGRLGKFQK